MASVVNASAFLFQTICLRIGGYSAKLTEKQELYLFSTKAVVHKVG